MSIFWFNFGFVIKHNPVGIGYNDAYHLAAGWNLQPEVLNCLSPYLAQFRF